MQATETENFIFILISVQMFHNPTQPTFNELGFQEGLRYS